MRATLVILATLSSAFACAHDKRGEPASNHSESATVAEHEGAALDRDACSNFLADAPPTRSGEFMEVSDELMAAAMDAAMKETQPRCAHYVLIHRVLAEQFLDDPRVSAMLWEHDGSVELLEDLAVVVNGYCAAERLDDWAMPAPSFRLGRTELLGRPVVVVDVIPPPIATTEGHMFALVGQPWAADADRRAWTSLDRYFVLEHSVPREPHHTVVGGWTKVDGALTHLNMGEGPQATPAAFVHVIGQNLCGNFIEAQTRFD